MNEFSIIEKYFNRKKKSSHVSLGIGDDAALMTVPENMELAVTVDALVENTHFFPNADPYHLGWKALAVSLSDLAAMGAAPHSALLSLTLPAADEAWIAEFSRGFFVLADQYNLPLIGGNLTRGPLNITSIVHGLVPKNKALKRNGAKPGDGIFVTGNLGDAGAGMQCVRDKLPDDSPVILALKKAWQFPNPRIQEGLALRDFASACIDISDGLLADLQHILTASGVGASVDLNCLPISEALLKLDPHFRGDDTLLELAATSGEDYELCFTVSPEKIEMLEKKSAENTFHFTKIGEVESTTGLRIVPIELSKRFSKYGFVQF